MDNPVVGGRCAFCGLAGGDHLMTCQRETYIAAGEKIAAPRVLDLVPPKTLQEAATVMILAAGDDPDRPGLKETPERFRKAWEEMTCGNKVDIPSLFKQFDESEVDEMITVRDIDFCSFCEHHMLPFYGTADIAYIPPPGKILGLSKVARLVEAFAKRLQVQERLTKDIAKAFYTNFPGCIGVACRVKARHFCMCARGVKQPHAVMVTTSLFGAFREKDAVRAEFFSCISGGN